jgi:uncharacterized protein (TIGR02231 family)
MKKLIYLFVIGFSVMAAAQKPIFTDAKIESATVYFNSAELTHSTSANLPKGTSEIVIKNIANHLNESTIQIKAPKDVTVLSVQFTTNYISEYEIDETSPAIKQVRDSIKIVESAIKKTVNAKISENKTIDLLDKNQQIAGQNTGLSVAELTKMVDFYKSKRNELQNNFDLLEEKEKQLRETLARLNSQLKINTSKEEKTSNGKLILQVMSDVASKINFEISYITPYANWTPFYDLRAESVTAPLDLMYKAQVAQNTGIDWKKVKLTLSSGSSNQNNQIPILSSWFLRYHQPISYVSVEGYRTTTRPQANVIQTMSGQVPGLEIQTGSASLDDYTTVTENQLNVSFDIDIPYDILSNGKLHSVALKELKLPAKYTYYSAPRVEKEAFLVAEIDDYSQYNLLPGEANIIFEGMYVGKTYINPNQTAESLKLTMGRDKRVSVKREKVTEKSGTKFLSSYKEQTFTFDITLKNDKKETVELLLKDQYPLSTDKEITIELLGSNKAQINPETGILTWDVKLKPGEIQKFRISYKVKYPKDKTIGNL